MLLAIIIGAAILGAVIGTIKPVYNLIKRGRSAAAEGVHRAAEAVKPEMPSPTKKRAS